MLHGNGDAWRIPAAWRNLLGGVITHKPCGLFTDIDGTISPIAPTPASATLSPEMPDLLAQAVKTFALVATISGRAAADAYRLVGVPGILYIGNHGLERIEPFSANDAAGLKVEINPVAQSYIPIITSILQQVGQLLEPQFPDMLVELKGVTGSVHVRNTPDPAIAFQAVDRELVRLATPHKLNITYGKMVIELRPPVQVDKGTSIVDAIRAHDLNSAVYFGDDRTDIDAFQALHQLRQTSNTAFHGVAVAVMHSESPVGLAENADIALDTIAYVPRMFAWLIEHARV